MKRVIAICLSLLLMLAFAACGSSEKAETSTQENNKEPVKDEVTEEKNPDSQKYSGLSESTIAVISAISPETAEDFGICGKDLTWYYSHNILVIMGTGEMSDFESKSTLDNKTSNAPWREHRDQIHTVVIDDGITSVGDYSFGDWLGDSQYAIETLFLPNTLLKIGRGAFASCRQLKQVTLPDSLEYIGVDAFSGCKELTGLTIPASVISIESNAFGDCKNLKDIIIPSSVEYFCNAFPSADNITFLGDCPQNITYPGDISDTGGKTIYYSSDSFQKIVDADTRNWFNWVKK